MPRVTCIESHACMQNLICMPAEREMGVAYAWINAGTALSQV